MKKLLTKWDIILIVFLLAVSLLMLSVTFTTGTFSTNKILIVKNGSNTTSYSMNSNKYINFSKNGFKCTLQIKDKKARIYRTDCPNKICLKKGWIGDSGSSIICAPMRISAQIKGIIKKELDAVNY